MTGASPWWGYDWQSLDQSSILLTRRAGVFIFQQIIGADQGETLYVSNGKLLKDFE